MTECFGRWLKPCEKHLFELGFQTFALRFNQMKPFKCHCLNPDLCGCINMIHPSLWKPSYPHYQGSCSALSRFSLTLWGLKRLHRWSYGSTLQLSGPESGADIPITPVWLVPSMRVNGGEARKRRRSWRSEGWVCVSWKRGRRRKGGGGGSSHN